GGFDNGKLVKSNSYRIKIDRDKIYSFKITAVNEGGESFPSEILSVSRSSKNLGEVLIVNAFDKVSAPAGFMRDSTMVGFLNQVDPGMPYLYDISFTGEQYEFNRSQPWISDDVPGFGASHAQYETLVLAGNTFDYPYLHGKAINEAGYSFVSAGKEAVLSGRINLNDYKLVDLILGSQKQTFTGNGQKPADFKTFPLDLQEKIQTYCFNGGNIFVSGSYIASDMMNEEISVSDKFFIEQVLKYKLLTTKGAVRGKAKTIKNRTVPFNNREFSFYDEPNEDSYYVLLPDAIEPVDKNGFVFCRYGENNLSAGVGYEDKKYKVCALAFPFETIKEENNRNELMNSILTFLNKK
ncbi:xanthan lyase, partial [Paludibacteraceae bacterium OttesenSCG-928-F17]|nr:xanthan lyase [Paludibacteraceae bacterium OttesenSCG-928-F17]